MNKPGSSVRPVIILNLCFAYKKIGVSATNSHQCTKSVDSSNGKSQFYLVDCQAPQSANANNFYLLRNKSICIQNMTGVYKVAADFDDCHTSSPQIFLFTCLWTKDLIFCGLDF